MCIALNTYPADINQTGVKNAKNEIQVMREVKIKEKRKDKPAVVSLSLALAGDIRYKDHLYLVKI